MALRPLGRTGLAVSPLGLGTVAWGRTAGLNYPRTADLPADAALEDLLAAAEALGINLIDTAPAYGVSEARIGALLEGRRARWVLSSKAGERFADGRSHFDFSPEAICASAEASLRRLRTGHLDLLLIHSDGIEEGEAKFGPAAAALARLKQQGLVRAVGFSGKTVAGGLWACGWADALMVSFNQQERDQLPVIAAAQAAGLGVLVKKPLAAGRLGPAALAPLLATQGVTSLVLGTTSRAHLAEAAAALPPER